MHSRSLPRAAPSADKISDRLDDGSAVTSRSVSPCSRVSCWRADETGFRPEISAITSSGWASAVRTSPAIRPCRRTTMRLARRNIWSMSWQASKIVVPCCRSPMISSSTCTASFTPSEEVGSSRASSRGLRPMARATATSCRCPPVSERTSRVVSLSGMRSEASSSVAAMWDRVSDISSRRRSRPSMMLAATSRFSHRARSCQTTAIPCLIAAAWSGGMRRPAKNTSPLSGTTSPAMQRTRVVLPAPFSPARATSSPVCTLRLTSSRARSRPKLTLSPDTVSSGAAKAPGPERRASERPVSERTGSPPGAASGAATEAVMPSLCGLSRALGHTTYRPHRADQVLSQHPF